MRLVRKISPALTLWLIAPIFGELVSGSSPLNEYIQPGNGAYLFPVAMILLLVFDGFVLWLILVMGPLLVGNQYPVMYFSNPVFLLALWWIARRVHRRYGIQPARFPS